MFTRPDLANGRLAWARACLHCAHDGPAAPPLPHGRRRPRGHARRCPERLALAEATLRGLAAGAEMPPKIGVHPRPAESFAHAMPALLPGAADDGTGDRLGMKWVAGNPANNAVGLAGIYGLLLLNDPVTTAPIAILDAGPITARAHGGDQRGRDPGLRAAAPDAPARAAGGADRGRRPGPQPRRRCSGMCCPGAALPCSTGTPQRAASLADVARRDTGHRRRPAWPPPHATRSTGADVVITAASFVRAAAAPGHDQRLARPARARGARSTTRRTAPPRSPARPTCSSWTTRPQFLANREAGNFDGYPEPMAMIGEALAAGGARPDGAGGDDAPGHGPRRRRPRARRSSRPPRNGARHAPPALTGRRWDGGSRPPACATDRTCAPGAASLTRPRRVRRDRLGRRGDAGQWRRTCGTRPARPARRGRGAGPGRGRRGRRPAGRHHLGGPAAAQRAPCTCRASRATCRSPATSTASPRSPPPPRTTCSTRRAGSTPPSACGRWRSGGASAPGGWRSCSARARSPPTRSSARMNWRGAAQHDLDALSDEARGFLQAYADGVNAYLARPPGLARARLRGRGRSRAARAPASPACARSRGRRSTR